MANRDAWKKNHEGNTAHLENNFGIAAECYAKAIELDPTEIAFYANLAAVHMALNDPEKCIEICDKAIAVGRENHANFKLIAKAMIWKGYAMQKVGNMAGAKSAYERGITEFCIQHQCKGRCASI